MSSRQGPYKASQRQSIPSTPKLSTIEARIADLETTTRHRWSFLMAEDLEEWRSQNPNASQGEVKKAMHEIYFNRLRLLGAEFQ